MRGALIVDYSICPLREVMRGERGWPLWQTWLCRLTRPSASRCESMKACKRPGMMAEPWACRCWAGSGCFDCLPASLIGLGDGLAFRLSIPLALGLCCLLWLRWLIGAALMIEPRFQR